MLRRVWPAVAVALGAAPGVRAQGAAATPAPVPTTPAPPPARVDAQRVLPYRNSLRMVIAGANGREQQIGSLDDVVTLGTDHGAPAIIRVQSIESPTGSMTDSAVADAATLLPRWHSSHGERRTLRLEFGNRRVTGTLKEAGDPSIPIDQPVADGVFDSNMLDVLLAALPLAAGYSGRLTVYLYEAGGEVPVDVAVTGSEKVGAVDTWAVAVTLGGRTAQYYVDREQRHTVQIVSHPAAGAELRLVPQDD